MLLSSVFQYLNGLNSVRVLLRCLRNPLAFLDVLLAFVKYIYNNQVDMEMLMYKPLPTPSMEIFLM